MQKKLLLISICIILSSQAILAKDCNKNGCPVSTENTAVSCPPCHITKAKLDCPQMARQYKLFVNKIKRERATVYNALNLTDEQIKSREELVQKNTPFYEEKFEQLMKESFRLKALKDASATSKEINNQEKTVKNIKKDIENALEKENKEFRKCLNREQRSKYSMIKKLERKDYKESCRQKDLYKKNPQMRPFGNPKKCPCE